MKHDILLWNNLCNSFIKYFVLFWWHLFRKIFREIFCKFWSVGISWNICDTFPWIFHTFHTLHIFEIGFNNSTYFAILHTVFHSTSLQMHDGVSVSVTRVRPGLGSGAGRLMIATNLQVRYHHMCGDELPSHHRTDAGGTRAATVTMTSGQIMSPRPLKWRYDSIWNLGSCYIARTGAI